MYNTDKLLFLKGAVLYHAAPTQLIPSIKKKGLVPHTNPNLSGGKSGIYLGILYDAIDIYVDMTVEGNKQPGTPAPYNKYLKYGYFEVKLHKDMIAEPDMDERLYYPDLAPQFHGHMAWIVFEPIPREALTYIGIVEV